MPSFSDLQSNDLDADTTTWFTRLLAVIESLDAAAYAALMREDVDLRLPDGTVLHGRSEVARVLHEAWVSVSALEHRELNIRGGPGHIVHEALVVTTTVDGHTSRVHSTSWIDVGPDGQIASARVYG